MRKSMLLVTTLLFCGQINPAFAGCKGWGCVSKAGGDIVDTVKHAGGVAASLSHDAQREIEQMPSNLASIWHNVYGIVPDWAANYINNYAAEAVGAYLGGIEGAALGKVLHEVYRSFETSIVAAKQADNDHRPSYVQKLIMDIGVHAASTKASAASDYGPDSANYNKMASFLNDLQAAYVIKANFAVDEIDARNILKSFKKEILAFELEL